MRTGAETTDPGVPGRTATAAARVPVTGPGHGLGPVERVASIDSTNAELLRRARAGAPSGLVLVADAQTAGRGRLGRRWEAAPGSSLLVSVLLRPTLRPAEAHLVTAAAALAAIEACQLVAGVRPGLKWPNDLVVADRKLAGLLTEATTAGDRLEAVVVGMGLNVRWADPMPGELASTATSLNHEAPGGAAPDRERVLGAWLDAFGGLLETLETAEGRRALADRHRAACVTLGRRVRVERVATDSVSGAEGGGALGGLVEGTAADIGEDGRLVVVDDLGRRHQVAVGDVVHLRPA